MHDHHSLLDEVHQVIPDDELLCDLADLFKIFADSTRIRDPLRPVRIGNVRMRHRGAAWHEPIGHLPPAEGAEKQ